MLSNSKKRRLYLKHTGSDLRSLLRLIYRNLALACRANEVDTGSSLTNDSRHRSWVQVEDLRPSNSLLNVDQKVSSTARSSTPNTITAPNHLNTISYQKHVNTLTTNSYQEQLMYHYGRCRLAIAGISDRLIIHFQLNAT